MRLAAFGEYGSYTPAASKSSAVSTAPIVGSGTHHLGTGWRPTNQGPDGLFAGRRQTAAPRPGPTARPLTSTFDEPHSELASLTERLAARATAELAKRVRKRESGAPSPTSGAATRRQRSGGLGHEATVVSPRLADARLAASDGRTQAGRPRRRTSAAAQPRRFACKLSRKGRRCRSHRAPPLAQPFRCRPRPPC